MKNKKLYLSLVLFSVSLIVLWLPVDNDAGTTHCFGKCGVVDTGQTTSYDIGDDADYNPAGAQLSYTVNSDNTVTDNRTGLMWRRCSQGKTDDATCSGTAVTYTWTDALAQCETEASDYSDWRLPNMKELFSIIKYEGTAPFIDQTAFPSTVSSAYWVSTTYVPDPTIALYVNFGGGTVSGVNKINSNSVRCVRAGP
ncbi:MAG: hypothetical protein A2X28_03650 [Elusimicrobia bacterium GWA2_56_46]|nr:MAG: hypothetical protein A2X28_03650 [Elusimicrobia bacterium GWA2_56_46]OGR54969.1 MAG: hypothetical protein A2X39_02585 [Elusimicrobia bacterium GWC2_56_31]HBB66666.1 hypothetical protein [Elusimicrobiota bacterium]HBW24021.1 hypothetical protein [Elusimicrobiota bacterium]